MKSPGERAVKLTAAMLAIAIEAGAERRGRGKPRTRRQVADDCGLTESCLSNLLSARRNTTLSMDSMLRVADAVGMPLSELLSIAEERASHTEDEHV